MAGVGPTSAPGLPLAGFLTEWVLSLALEAADQAVDVAEHEQIAHFGALEGEDRHAGPPNMPTTWWHVEQFLAMEAVESHLAADTVAFLDHRQDVGGVLAEGAGHPVDVTRELIVAHERRPQRAAECKAIVEDPRYQALVSMVPQFLVEHGHRFLLR